MGAERRARRRARINTGKARLICGRLKKQIDIITRKYYQNTRVRIWSEIMWSGSNMWPILFPNCRKGNLMRFLFGFQSPLNFLNTLLKGTSAKCYVYLFVGVIKMWKYVFFEVRLVINWLY
jgi:hypothetical protein